MMINASVSSASSQCPLRFIKINLTTEKTEETQREQSFFSTDRVYFSFIRIKDKSKSIIMTDNELTEIIIGCAIKVHRRLGPGLLESAYQECLLYELMKTNLSVIKEKPQPLIYDEVHLNCGYRIDLFVENRIIIEVKSVESLNEIHLAQILTYLKLSKCRFGLLLNFNVPRMTDGIKRVINKHVD